MTLHYNYLIIGNIKYIHTKDYCRSQLLNKNLVHQKCFIQHILAYINNYTHIRKYKPT